ncbi:MAG: DUF6732 family protein [Pseudomonadota bacterium]
MKRLSTATFFSATSVSASFAHGGHLTAQDGHSHWVAVAAALVAVAIFIGGVAVRFAKRRTN